MPEITTQWQRFEALTVAELYELLRFRQNIFVVEQRSPYPDLDGLDQNACHLVARFEGELAGYLRLFSVNEPPATVTIGRVAVEASLRHQGIGRMLIDQALLLCRERHPRQPVTLSAQHQLTSLYESFGFVCVSDPYDEFGVPHIDMVLPPGS